MKRYFLLLSLSLGPLVPMHAQSLEEYRSEWNESSANVSDNIRYTSLNPSRISSNSYKQGCGQTGLYDWTWKLPGGG